MRRKRRVRLHFLNADPSIEGIQVGRRLIGGHYVIAQPKLLEAENRTIPLTGHVEVHADRVFFVQVDP